MIVILSLDYWYWVIKVFNYLLSLCLYNDCNIISLGFIAPCWQCASCCTKSITHNPLKGSASWCCQWKQVPHAFSSFGLLALVYGGLNLPQTLLHGEFHVPCKHSCHIIRGFISELRSSLRDVSSHFNSSNYNFCRGLLSSVTETNTHVKGIMIVFGGRSRRGVARRLPNMFFRRREKG